MDTLNWVLLAVMAFELSAIVSLLGVNCLLHARTGRPLVIRMLGSAAGVR